MLYLWRLFNNTNCTRVLILAAGLSVTAVLLLSNALAEQTRNPGAVQQRMQPLDPLTPEEIDLASQVASADARVKAALGVGPQQLIRVEFLALKSPAYRDASDPVQMKIGRHASVIFLRYDDNVGIHVVVDLEQKTAGEITKLDGRVVPLAAAEVTLAFNLALKNERVRGLLGPGAAEFRVAGASIRDRPENRVEGLRVVGTSPNDPCYRHRCLDLIFRQRQGYIAGTEVTVDLTAQTVRVERTGR